MNTTQIAVNKDNLSTLKTGMPVTIITGFLGSGKTTLLNQILKNKKDLKVAVLVNEFGDINIDSQLLVTNEDGMVELSNGCICCTINEDLVEAVYRVLEREDKIDYLVIETTGVADPLPIVMTFLGTQLRDLTCLDSIITLVDAEAFTPTHFESEAALKQIVYGDMVLLNKTDRANQGKLEELESYLKTIKQGARIIHCQHGKVPLPLILGVGLTPVNDYSNIQENKKHDEHHHHHDHSEHHRHNHHSHHLDNDEFISISFQSDRPFDVYKFEKFLTEKMPQDVFRAKGILWFSNSDSKHIFQLSGPRYDLNVDSWKNAPSNQLVVIGRHLNANQIRQHLEECLVN